jgi:hypothetical protein
MSMWSVPSRRREFSTAVVIQRREPPCCRPGRADQAPDRPGGPAPQAPGGLLRGGHRRRHAPRGAGPGSGARRGRPRSCSSRPTPGWRSGSRSSTWPCGWPPTAPTPTDWLTTGSSGSSTRRYSRRSWSGTATSRRPDTRPPSGGSSRPSSNIPVWSGRRDSNPLPQPWEVEALLRQAADGLPEFDRSGFVPVALLSSTTCNWGGYLPDRGRLAPLAG